MSKGEEQALPIALLVKNVMAALAEGANEILPTMIRGGFGQMKAKEGADAYALMKERIVKSEIEAALEAAAKRCTARLKALLPEKQIRVYVQRSSNKRVYFRFRRKDEMISYEEMFQLALLKDKPEVSEIVRQVAFLNATQQVWHAIEAVVLSADQAITRSLAVEKELRDKH